MSDEVKTCANCFKTKSVQEFYPRRKGSESRQWWCKACANEIHKNWYSDRKQRELGPNVKVKGRSS